MVRVAGIAIATVIGAVISAAAAAGAAVVRLVGLVVTSSYSALLEFAMDVDRD